MITNNLAQTKDYDSKIQILEEKFSQLQDSYRNSYKVQFIDDVKKSLGTAFSARLNEFCLEKQLKDLNFEVKRELGDFKNKIDLYEKQTQESSSQRF